MTESNLSKAIADHFDGQHSSQGPWANAWAPAWGGTPTASSATDNRQTEVLHAAPETTAPDEAPQMQETEPIYA
ncbi:MAG: hypothetical protein JXB07_15170 [Anaerolineae bacterium]|nr:hypothetical protein [Anaerolineae bacterium]